MIQRGIMNCLFIAAFLALPSGAVADSFLERLSNFFNLGNSASQMKGPGDEVATGSIWTADIEKKTATQVTQEEGYRSPVFTTTDAGIFALKDDTLVRIKPGGSPEEVRKISGIVKLIGFDSKNPDDILVLLKDDNAPLGVLSLKTGSITLLPYDPKSDDHKLALARIRGQGRSMGTTRVFVKKLNKQGMTHIIEWTDVYVKRGDAEPQNVSGCDGINCAQPALSHDGRQVVFVRSEE